MHVTRICVLFPHPHHWYLYSCSAVYITTDPLGYSFPSSRARMSSPFLDNTLCLDVTRIATPTTTLLCRLSSCAKM